MFSLKVLVARLQERVDALDKLMSARFVTVEAMMMHTAEKVALALQASQTAIDKSDQADEKARDRLAEDMQNRFSSVNEFRQTLSDQASTFVPRAEFQTMKEKHAEDMAGLKERLDKAEGKTLGSTGVLAAIGGVVTLVVIIVNVVIYAVSNG